MSHGDHGTILVGSDNGTITISPATGTNLHWHQGRYIVATIKMSAGNSIPDGATINFSAGNSGNSANFVALPDVAADWKQIPIVVDAHDNTQGTATLPIRYDPTQDINASLTVTVHASAGTGWGPSPTPNEATAVSYTVLKSDPKVTCLGPTKTLLPIPTAADGDQLTPAKDAFTTKFTCQVVDDSTSPPTPLPEYIVEWHEAASGAQGLFDGLMNVYVAGTAAENLLAPDNPFMFYSETQQGFYLRTETNAQGIAELYLVATHSNGPVALGLRAQYDFAETREQGRPFLVVDVTATGAGLEESFPVVQGLATSTTTGKTTLDYGQLSSAFVDVAIGKYPNQVPGDQIYLVVNGVIAAGPYKNPMENTPSWTWATQFAESLGYSDSGAHADELNSVLFVVSNIETGNVGPSLVTQFYGVGDNQQGIIPSGGPLGTPRLSPARSAINRNSLRGPITITFKLDQTYDNGWRAQAGDKVTAHATLTGFKTKSTTRRDPVQVSTAQVTIGAADLNKPTLSMQFANDDFHDWDSMDGHPWTEGQCYVVYTIERSGIPDQTSKVLAVTLNTANRS